MIGWQNIFGILAGILVFVAYVWYCRAINNGTTKPNRMTWVTVALVSWVLLQRAGLKDGGEILKIYGNPIL